MPLNAAVACPQELVGLWDSRICGVLPDGECELLYGRAGYLYSLTWLQQQLGRDTVPDSLIKVRTEEWGGQIDTYKGSGVFVQAWLTD